MPATAYAPGSVTIVFVPQDSDASLGVSFATAGGATATVEEGGAESSVSLNGRPVHIAPVTGVLDRLGTTATVRLETDVPIGCGFGVSGAATLATALAVNEEQALGHDRDELVEASHRAEVAAGTGLGDVFVQERGGLVWNTGEGVERIPRTDRIEYATYGGITTADVIGDDETIERVARVGRNALATLDPEGPLEDLFEVSWTFAKRTGLAPERIAEDVREARRADGAATMAMLGETVVTTGTEGLLDHETRITPTGAELR